MSNPFPGRYFVSHGIWPLPTPDEPGQEISIAFGNPQDIVPVAWNLLAPPGPPLAQERFILATDDRTAYLALQNPSIETGGLTTSTDARQALFFTMDLAFLASNPSQYRLVCAGGGLVTLVPPPPGIDGSLGSVQVQYAAGDDANDSQVWRFEHAPAPNA